eukprot:TRINITY_DN6775_c0_g1_i1.p1 TRINITY_DN6775_c0_g1~~TRINITY_DN6775_c0_g1_i1.p1  ORF type:complete len:258 (+),score=31.65 TRINITY_DN6775_c0_g1_i1:94-867(+)
MPMPQMREGDWNCPACGNHNYANRVACNKCAAPKQGNGGKGGYGGFIGYGQSKGAGKGREAAAPYNAGDWSCPGCGNHNYAKRMQCNRCAAPRPGAAPYGQMGNGFGQQQGGAAFGGKMMMMAVPVDMRPGDWLCRACGNHNYANRDNCNKCAMAKTVFIAKGGMRDGDWVCSGCQNHNYYFLGSRFLHQCSLQVQRQDKLQQVRTAKADFGGAPEEAGLAGLGRERWRRLRRRLRGRPAAAFEAQHAARRLGLSSL